MAAAHLLHLPLTGAVDACDLQPPSGRRDVAGRLRRRYKLWFYSQLDDAYAPSRPVARSLVAGGVDHRRVTVLPGPARPQQPHVDTPAP